MPCYYPVTAYRTEGGGVVFAERGSILSQLTLACGRCIGCRLDRSRNWAVRCMHEAQMHRSNSFITLTYDDDHLPVGGSLDYSHFQKFVRRLRKARKGETVRYFMCGEYGETTWRPHFHACLFGVGFPDRRFFKKTAGGSDLYVSDELNELWQLGENNSIGDVTFETAAYAARYVCKKVTGLAAAEHYVRVDPRTGLVVELTPEFAHMSLKPGIGEKWFAKFHTDVYGEGKDSVVMNGSLSKPPRYYDKLLKELNPDLHESVTQRRALESDKRDWSEQSERRLRVKEQVTRARIRFKQRNLE